jgi:hypothetical protein
MDGSGTIHWNKIFHGCSSSTRSQVGHPVQREKRVGCDLNLGKESRGGKKKVIFGSYRSTG